MLYEGHLGRFLNTVNEGVKKTGMFEQYLVLTKVGWPVYSQEHVVLAPLESLKKVR